MAEYGYHQANEGNRDKEKPPAGVLPGVLSPYRAIGCAMVLLVISRHIVGAGISACGLVCTNGKRSADEENFGSTG